MLNEILVGAIILVVIRVLALPLSLSFARLWMSIYTAGVPSNLREDRRAEILSDLHEQVTDIREQGYRPDEIAITIMLRVVRGMKDDVAWSAPHLPGALAEQFERGSEALSHIGTPKFITTAMAVIGMMNCAWLMSDGDKTWVSWFILNGVALTFSVLMGNQQHRWARRLILLFMGLAFVGGLATILYLVLDRRLYESPSFNQTMLGFALALLPLFLLTVVSSETCRVRLFRRRWWPIFSSSVLSIVGALWISSYMGLTATLVMVWMLLASLAVGYMVLAAMFLGGASIVWYVGLRGGAAGMRLLADRIRSRVQG